MFEIERDKAWVGREMRGIRLGLCLGQVWVRRFGSGSGREGGVRWRLVGLSLLGPKFRRFQSARRILTFYISTESSRRVGHDKPIFREIRGPEMIGDFSHGHRGVWDQLSCFLIRPSDLGVLYMCGKLSMSRSRCANSLGDQRSRDDG